MAPVLPVAVAMFAGCVVGLVGRSLPAGDAGFSPAENDTRAFLWKPYWRSSNDCGPTALYVLLRLMGNDATIEDVGRRIHVDPGKGCSLSDLAQAASDLGLATDVKFVSAADFHKLRFPVILHGNSGVTAASGHFTVIVDRNDSDGSYAVIDTRREMFAWYPEKSILTGYSGYVLVPRDSVVNRWSGIVAVLTGLTIIGAVRGLSRGR